MKFKLTDGSTLIAPIMDCGFEFGPQAESSGVATLHYQGKSYSVEMKEETLRQAIGYAMAKMGMVPDSIVQAPPAHLRGLELK